MKILRSLILIVPLVLFGDGCAKRVTNAMIYRQGGQILGAISRLDSTYNAYNLKLSDYEKARLDSAARRMSTDELLRGIDQLLRPTKP